MFKGKNFIKLVVVILLSITVLFSFGCKKSTSSTKGKTTYVLSQIEITLQVGQTQQIEVLRSDNKPVTDPIEWEILNLNVATVDSNGLITAKIPNTTYLNVTVGEQTLVCKIIVVNPSLPAPVLSLDGLMSNDGVYEINLWKGGSYQLNPVLRMDGTIVESAEISVTTTSDKISVSNTTINADDVCENAVVTVSCEYAGASLSLTVYVSVSEIGGVA